MRKQFWMDLHIHTCLSPCGQPEMVPTRIASRAQELNLQAIAICDHNSTENVEAVRRACRDKGLTVFGGIEIASQEEIHILALFEIDEDLSTMQTIIYQNLQGKNDSQAFGEQFIVDEEDYVNGYNERLLIGATNLSVDRIVSLIHKNNGLAIASHIDRDAFSIISQLGVIPGDLKLDALELSPHFKNSHHSFEDYSFPLVTFSDAHQLKDIGRSTTGFYIKRVTINEIRNALLNRRGRKVLLQISLH